MLGNRPIEHSRRDCLRAGALAGFGLGWPQLPALRAAAEGASAPRAKACIQLYLWGGPGQHETWDLKPHAPDKIRGDFQSINTSVAGERICEHLPRLAQRAQHYSIIRSLTHEGVNHGTSSYHMLTGHVHPTPGTLRHPTPNDLPNIGASAGRFLRHPHHLPPHVQLPAVINDGDGLPVPGQGAGLLGEAHAPFLVLGDLTRPEFRVDALEFGRGLSRERLGERLRLHAAVSRQASHLGQDAVGRAVDISFLRAADLLSSHETARAFDLSREPPALREAYGRHHFAQALLLARRLVEAGVPFVTVYWDSPRNTDDESWDTHQDQHRRMSQKLLPAFDRAVAAFLDDLRERGLLDETLVTWYGEFGRTPRINRQGGRDHWGFCQSVGLTGAGIRPGLFYGTSTGDGGYAASLPVRPDDLAATIFHCLGIDHHQLLRDPLGRPFPISHGEPVHDLLI